MKIKSDVKLDHAKLLGFRNLVPVTAVGCDLLQASEHAFNRKGLNGESNDDPDPSAVDQLVGLDYKGSRRRFHVCTWHE